MSANSSREERDSQLNGLIQNEIRLGAPTLRVRDIERTLEFYEIKLGLQANRRKSAEDGLETLELGFKNAKNYQEPLLILKSDPNAKETPHNFAGLYHFAILVPERRSLALAYSVLERAGVRFDGFADHLVSESLYLHDPERNGIEIYRDRPRGEWPRDSRGHILMDTLPLNLGSLMAEMGEDKAPTTSFPNGARIGHVHLRVTNLERSVSFYREKLGLEIMVNLSFIGATFLSTGGYHHHLGLNTWHSLGGSARRQHEAGLEHFKIAVPDGRILKALASRFPDSSGKSGRLSILDPDGIRIVIESQYA